MSTTPNRDDLRRAAAAQLREQQGLKPEEADEAAGEILPGLEKRFGTWVRREYRLRQRRRRKVKAAAAAAMESDRLDTVFYERMSLELRIMHGIMAVSVLLLVFTGLPLKFKDFFLSKAIISVVGGIEVSKIIHRVSAAGLIFVGVWHLAWIVVTRAGRKTFGKLIPKLQDGKDALQQIRYFLHLAPEKPKYDKYSYVEKFDYWAVYWGMVIMIGSGAVLWFKDFFLKYFPLWATDIAKEMHSDEALLATLAIVIWHFYNVHFNPHSFPMNPTFLTGKISARQMMEEHALEYERILAEEAAGKKPTEGDSHATPVVGHS
jgi:formate dehydrogenase subunit gamma